MNQIINYHHVCINCRRCVKEFYNSRMWQETQWMDAHRLPCAVCGNGMFCVGKSFTAPPKRDDKQWKKLEWMIRNGWRGNDWPTTPKMGLREVKASVEEAKTQRAKAKNKMNEFAALENARKAANYNSVRSKTMRKRKKVALEAHLKASEEYQLSVLKSLGLE